MTDIAMKAKVGFAAIAVAASATLIPITVAEAAPVQAPATPVLFGPGNVPQGWWFSGPEDLGSVWSGGIGKIFSIFSLFHLCGGYGHHSW
jgi:hypothetical protein